MINNEIKKGLKLTIIFKNIMLGMMILWLLLYPLINKNYTSISNMLYKTPKLFINLFNIDLTNLNQLKYYYALLIKLLFILGGIYAFYLGFNQINIDKKDNYYEFYKLKPISKEKLIQNKIYAPTIQIIISNIIYTLVCTILIKFLNKDSFSIMLIIKINSTLILNELMFLLLGILTRLLINKKIWLISIILLLTLILIDIIDTNYMSLKYINLFNYFDINYLITYNIIKKRYVISSIFIIIFLYHFILGVYTSDETK